MLMFGESSWEVGDVLFLERESWKLFNCGGWIVLGFLYINFLEMGFKSDFLFW